MIEVRHHRLLISCLCLGIFYILGRAVFFDLSFQFQWQKVLHFLILAPILEELVFRGIGQKEILKYWDQRFWIFSGANIVTSFLFAGFHLWGNNVTHSLLVFFPSLIFGVLYERYSSVVPSIGVHSMYNLNVFFV